MIGNVDEQARAYKYLANYHLKTNSVEDAYAAAQKCTEFNEVVLHTCFSVLHRK